MGRRSTGSSPGGRMCAGKDRKKGDILGDTVSLDYRSVGPKVLR